MSSTQDKDLPVTPELVHAYFDGELEASVRARVEDAVQRHPKLREELETARLLREAVGAGLGAAASAVPEARFEQVWENIDRALDREARLRAAADREASIWVRLGSWMRQLRWPTVAAATAAVVTLVLVRSNGPEGESPPNTAEPVASVTPDVEPPAPTETPTVPDRGEPKIAQAEGEQPSPTVDPLPVPERNDAELELIEFGGKTGRISRIEGQRGTTTVIWVTEEEPIDSERSL